MKKILSSLIYYIISAVGISVTIKAGIGVSSFNSLNVSLSNVTTIQVGTVTTIINLVFLLGSLLVDTDRKVKKYLLMSIATLNFGAVINFVYYHLFATIDLTSYGLKISLFILGVLIAGFGTGQVLRINKLVFPIESLCQLLANRTTLSFSYYRYGVDILCVLLSLIISISFSLPIVVREGTLISLFLLSGVINWSKQRKLGISP